MSSLAKRYLAATGVLAALCGSRGGSGGNQPLDAGPDRSSLPPECLALDAGVPTGPICRQLLQCCCDAPPPPIDPAVCVAVAVRAGASPAGDPKCANYAQGQPQGAGWCFHGP
jgi:hypothetical protein